MAEGVGLEPPLSFLPLPFSQTQGGLTGGWAGSPSWGVLDEVLCGAGFLFSGLHVCSPLCVSR